MGEKGRERDASRLDIRLKQKRVLGTFELAQEGGRFSKVRMRERNQRTST
jgi:hypothetical protein